MGSCFEISILNAPAITRRSFYLVSAQVNTLFSRPLVHGETKVASSEIPSYFLMLNTFVSTSLNIIIYFSTKLILTTHKPNPLNKEK